MMQKFRENTKIILWIVVISFVITIFAVWGLDLQTGSKSIDPAVIGKVNGVPISRQQYQYLFEQMRQQYKANAPTDAPLDFSQEEFLRDQAWERIVYQIITDQQIKKYGITVTDEEIVSFLRNTPPAEVRQFFLDKDGNFDAQAYQAALNNPEVDWTNLEQIARERIPRLKLNGYLAAQVHITEDEVVQAFQASEVELKIRYVQFPFEKADLGDFQPSDEEIRAYYDDHTDDFLEPEKAKIEVVTIPIQPSAADVADAVDLAAWVREQAVTGEDFGDLANTYSEAPTSFSQGRTGFLRTGMRDPAYFAALEALQPSQVSEPVTTESGYYIVKLLDKKDNEEGEVEYQAQEILIKANPGRATTDSLFAAAHDLRDRAAEVGLAAASQEQGLTLLTPEPFSRSSLINGVGFVPRLNQFAFESEVGALSQVLRDEQRIYVAKLVERLPQAPTPFESIRDVVRERLLYERRKSVGLRDANAFARKAKSTSFDDAVETYHTEVEYPQPFHVVDDLEWFGPNSVVADAAMIIAEGETSPPVEWLGSYVVLQLLERSEFNTEKYQSRFFAIKDSLKSLRVQDYVVYWYDSIRKSSTIEDYRAGF